MPVIHGAENARDA